MATYYIKTPNGTNKKFSIIRKTQVNGAISTKTVKDARIVAINKAYLDGKKEYASVEMELRAVIESLKEPEIPDLLAPENMKLYRDYWKNVYAARYLKDEKSARCRLLRTIKALGQTSLYSADQKTLAAICRANKHPREITAVLGQLLKYIKRTDVVLPMPPKPRKTMGVAHVNEKEMLLLTKAAQDEFTKSLIICLFSTGCRIGELFGLTHTQGSFLVVEQMREDGTMDETKTRKTRAIPVIVRYEQEVINFINLPLEIKIKKRGKRWAEILTRLSLKVLGRKITPHDLRHSYAIHLLSKGIPIGQVALSLGNSIQVSQEHYVGYSLPADAIAQVRDKL